MPNKRCFYQDLQAAQVVPEELPVRVAQTSDSFPLPCGGIRKPITIIVITCISMVYTMEGTNQRESCQTIFTQIVRLREVSKYRRRMQSATRLV